MDYQDTRSIYFGQFTKFLEFKNEKVRYIY